MYVHRFKSQRLLLHIRHCLVFVISLIYLICFRYNNVAVSWQYVGGGNIIRLAGFYAIQRQNSFSNVPLTLGRNWTSWKTTMASFENNFYSLKHFRHIIKSSARSPFVKQSESNYTNTRLNHKYQITKARVYAGAQSVRFHKLSCESLEGTKES